MLRAIQKIFISHVIIFAVVLRAFLNNPHYLSIGLRWACLSNGLCPLFQRNMRKEESLAEYLCINEETVVSSDKEEIDSGSTFNLAQFAE